MNDIDIPITLRSGIEHRHMKPNFIVISHVYKQKPRLKWIKPLPKIKTPKCKCGKPCAYYGPIGGFSVKCVACNAKHAAWQRKNRTERAGKL
jgi:hypothetical protein